MENDYVLGLKKAHKIAMQTKRGKIAADAIAKEITTIRLRSEICQPDGKNLVSIFRRTASFGLRLLKNIINR